MKLFECSIVGSVVALGLAAAPVFAQATAPQVEAQQQGRPTLAIAEVMVEPAVAQAAEQGGTALTLDRLVAALRNALVARFSDANKFAVVQPSEDAEVRPAYEVRVRVDSFQDVEQVLRLEGRRKVVTRRQIQVGALLELRDGRTGEVLDTFDDLVELEGFETRGEDVREVGFGLDRGVRDAAGAYAGRALAATLNGAFPATIIDVADGGLLTINRGEGTGISEGEAWTLFRPGNELIDPDTGESLGVGEQPVGRVRIVRVWPRYSHAVALEPFDDAGDATPAKGMIVRPTGEVVSGPDANER